MILTLSSQDRKEENIYPVISTWVMYLSEEMENLFCEEMPVHVDIIILDNW